MSHHVRLSPVWRDVVGHAGEGRRNGEFGPLQEVERSATVMLAPMTTQAVVQSHGRVARRRRRMEQRRVTC